MIRPEYIEENFMDNLEAYDQADDGANPVAVKILAVTPPLVGNENQCKDKNLRD